MFNLLKKVFGTKYDKDVKEYSPVVDEINSHFESYKSLSNDQLRNKTLEFKGRIKDHLTNVNLDIDKLKEKADAESNFLKKEEIYEEIDKLSKERDQQLEVILKKLLPEAFAVIKETSRRFKDNENIEVTVTEFDRDIAASKSYVLIDGDKAV